MSDTFSPGDMPANPLEKPGYRLDFYDEFDGTDLDTAKWLPFHLPQWSSRASSAPNYQIRDGSLMLQITEEQQPWCPEFDGHNRCSSLQTGVFAGPLGSTVGQHRFNQSCVVREEQAATRTYTPRYGYFELRAKGVNSAINHVALWMIGYEDAPEKSGEIAIMEIMGKGVTARASHVGYGVHPWGDPATVDEFYEDQLPIDATRYHIYAAEWAPTHIDFYVDNQKIRTIDQSPAYPMQFMLGIYERPEQSGGILTFRWRTDESDDTIPYTHHGYAYALSNPVLLTDPTGKYACDGAVGYGYNPYVIFCQEQQEQLDRELNIDESRSVIKTRPLSTLIDLFTDPELPGGSGTEARTFRNQLLTPAAERLQFVLWYTQGVGRFSHDRLDFSDIDFAQEFRDADHWRNPNGTPYVSNQVNHFLTAVDLAYRSEFLTRVPPMLCLIGHEKYGQGTKSEPYQCTIGVNPFELFQFINAIRSDSAGDYATRDCLIAAILPDLPENEYRGSINLDDRKGNSRQDLRLSIKGWRFGLLIQDGTISTLEEAGNWLRRNLAPT